MTEMEIIVIVFLAAISVVLMILGFRANLKSRQREQDNEESRQDDSNLLAEYPY